MSVLEYGNPISFSGGAAFPEPLWRFVVTDLSGRTLTFLDKLATDRQITFRLNEATEITCTVPSDNPEVNILHTDGFPFVAEGVRCLYCYRRESNTSPYYVLRAAGLILQVDDAAASDDARTRITAWDPWKLLESRPVMTRVAPYIPVGLDELTYDTTFTAAAIVNDILTMSFNSANARKTLFPGIPTSTLRAFIDSSHVSHGTFAVPASSSPDGTYTIEQGTSVAAALQDLCAQGYLDILMVPYRNSPAAPNGYFAKLNMYSESSGGLGAGRYNYAAQFAWDRPGRNTVGMDNLYDGTGRANIIDYYNGQGGPPVVDDGAGLISSVGVGVMAPDSLVQFGEYWAQQWFPAQVEQAAVIAIARQQLDLRKNFKQTLTVNPSASGRAPDPFLDYGLGDRVPIYASNRMRQSLPPGSPAPPLDPPILAWQRIYGIPLVIDDNGTELVNELIVGPVGNGPVIGGAAPLENRVGVTTSLSSSASMRRRVGTLSSPGRSQGA